MIPVGEERSAKSHVFLALMVWAALRTALVLGISSVLHKQDRYSIDTSILFYILDIIISSIKIFSVYVSARVLRAEM